jgi:hypothetical protein
MILSKVSLKASPLFPSRAYERASALASFDALSSPTRPASVFNRVAFEAGRGLGNIACTADPPSFRVVVIKRGNDFGEKKRVDGSEDRDAVGSKGTVLV